MLQKKKTIARLAIAGLVLITIFIIACNHIITSSAQGKTYSDIALVPYNKTGLLLGTSKLGRTGYNNPFYDNRIAAAVQLLKAGKIKYLIISGDNSRKEYNEPEDMRRDLINAGIDSTVIFLDYAGFRTFDSMVRLKEIFGQEQVTVISQRFHNERAIYSASQKGIAAIGFNAADVSARQGIRTGIREKLARVKAVLDIWLGKQPKFYGEKIHLPA